MFTHIDRHPNAPIARLFKACLRSKELTARFSHTLDSLLRDPLSAGNMEREIVRMRDAIADAGLAAEQVSSPRVGVIAGSGGGSAEWQIEAGDLMRQKGVRRVGPYMVPRTMCSTVSATLATAFGILGLSYSIAAACATSAHCIGAGADLIRHGAQVCAASGVDRRGLHDGALRCRAGVHDRHRLRARGVVFLCVLRASGSGHADERGCARRADLREAGRVPP